MKLHTLKNTEGAKSKRKRVGRGKSSGLGKTAGRGENGQLARSGATKHLHFEGGQMSLFRRLPKKGFKSKNKKEYAVINISQLDKNFESNAVIDPDTLVEKKVVPSIKDGVKILGDGNISKPFTVKSHQFSANAKVKIEEAGGKCVQV